MAAERGRTHMTPGYFRRPEAKARKAARAKRWWWQSSVEVCSPSGKVFRFTQRRRHVLEKTYGLSLQEFVTLLEKSDMRCGICEVPFDLNKPRNIHINHCYPTGRIRGLLCPSCNTGIGWLERVKRENIERFLA